MLRPPYSINSYFISLAGGARYKVNKKVQNIKYIAEFKYIIDIAVPNSIGNTNSGVNFNFMFLKGF